MLIATNTSTEREGQQGLKVISISKEGNVTESKIMVRQKYIDVSHSVSYAEVTTMLGKC